MPVAAGQEPSESCCDFRKLRPRVIWACADSEESASARRAQQVGSTRESPCVWKDQPPSAFCESWRLPRSAARSIRADSVFCDAIEEAREFIAECSLRMNSASYIT